MENKLIVPRVRGELSADRGRIQEESKEIAKALWSGKLTPNEQRALNQICLLYKLDPILKQVVMLGGNVYITGGGLRVIANQDKDTAINGLEIIPATKQEREDYGLNNTEVKDENYHHLFKALVWKKGCEKPFIEWGEANKANVKIYNADFKSIADMAKTRAANRAIRNAYGISFTSLEEIGYVEGQVKNEVVVEAEPDTKPIKEDKIAGPSNNNPKETKIENEPTNEPLPELPTDMISVSTALTKKVDDKFNVQGQVTYIRERQYTKKDGIKGDISDYTVKDPEDESNLMIISRFSKTKVEQGDMACFTDVVVSEFKGALKYLAKDIIKIF